MHDKAEIQFEDFARLDLRVATIIEAQPHPGADRLLKLQIDLGTEQRQICAGVRAHYEPAALVGRQIVVVANLAPRKIRGEVSNGMLLAVTVEASGDPPSSGDVVLLAADKPVPPGSRVG